MQRGTFVEEAPRGRAWVVDGELYFSPNSVTFANVPSHDAGPPAFHPGASKATNFQEPRWWNPRTEWMGFVPKIPVPYCGALLENLNTVPNSLTYTPSRGYQLGGGLSTSWKLTEQILLDIVRILEKSCDLIYLPPFAPREWKYHEAHPSFDTAMAHIKSGRDWFGLWIGLVYWLMRKTPEDPSFIEDISPPRWFIEVVRAFPKEQARWDMVRTAPIMQAKWKWNRVGLWLKNPASSPNQPPAQWFVDQGVSVWYRWGSKEQDAVESGSYFPLIKPSPEYLQDATTWITPSPYVTAEMYSIPNHYIWHDPCDSVFEPYPGPSSDFAVPACSATNSFSDPVQPYSTSPHALSQNPTTSQPEEIPCQSLPAACNEWKKFWAERREMHTRLLKYEAAAVKEARIKREWHDSKPSASAHVYVWKCDEKAHHFTQNAVAKSDRESVLVEFQHEILHYDTVFNEWHCCRRWGQSYDDDRGLNSSVSDPASQPTPHNFGGSADKESTLQVERTQAEILRLLSQHFGFIPPLPIPSSFDGVVGDSDEKSLLKVLGMGPGLEATEFFQTPLGKICQAFLKLFSGKESNKRPDSDLWDLSEDNRQTLAFSQRLSVIRTIKNSEQTWYMFDFSESRTVSWNLAVPTARTALYVCRLPNDIKEAGIAVHLAQEGISFHTVQRRDTLSSSTTKESMATIIPIRFSGHIFGRQDYELYLQQAEGIMALPRARAAIMRGGFARKVALEHMSVSEIAAGPRCIHRGLDEMFVAEDLNGVEYVDDNLTSDEFDVLCGLYITSTGIGSQTGKLSWYPLIGTFEGSGEDMGWWTGRAESLWEKRNRSILDGRPTQNITNLPMNATKWRDKLRAYGDNRRAQQRAESWSKEFIEKHGGEL
ncbi:hypothetical protein AN958_05881 [Leucoagaricus sp. SymC.cos]|nr:hypothetical protein AN958_05881 [Leucoagaricus sp. SymC.cos]